MEFVTSTAMGIVITDESGLTLTILFEVKGEDTTMEDGLVTTVEPDDCNRIKGRVALLAEAEEDDTI